MNFIDTHCHIHDRSSYDFCLGRNHHDNPADFTPEKILQRCADQNVTRMITIGTSDADSKLAKAFADEHENVFWTYGIHPDEAVNASDVINDLVGAVAIGEVGLDYRDGDTTRKQQIVLLERMLELALKNNLPLIFHVRDAFADFWPIVDNQHIKRAVVHSFSDSTENLKQALARGFYIGINGLATFAKLDCYQDPAILPLDRTLLETDAPFLAPVPNRGHVNDPSQIPNIAAWLANQKGITLEEVAKTTTNNASTLFNLS